MTELTPYQERRLTLDAARAEEQRREAATSKARSAEKVRRYQEARRRAYMILSTRHQEEFAALFETEKQGVNAERGPLPGDEV